MVVGFVYGVWFVLLVFGSCLFNVLDFCCWGVFGLGLWVWGLLLLILMLFGFGVAG